MKYSIRISLLLILIIGNLQLPAQIKHANLLFKQFEYSKAIPLYLKATEDKDENIRKEATLRLADCYRLTSNVTEARSWYAKAVLFKNVDPKNFLYLGMALRNIANYEEAEKAFLNYAEKFPADPRGKIYAQYCRDIKQWKGLEPSAEIKNAKTLNAIYSAFGSVFYKDGLIFTSDRDVDIINDKNYPWTNNGYLDLYFSQPNYYNDFWSDMTTPVKMSNRFNQPYHDGPACFTADFSKIFITRTLKTYPKKDSTDQRTDLLKIFIADLSDEKKVIYKEFPYNSEDYSVGHPTVSANGQKMIFSSNQPKGFGKSDLYSTELINGNWSVPVNLGAAVNTFGNEVFPFLANDSTLFFASDGLPGYGGLDLYETTRINGHWTTPVNLKAPLNSSYDDFSIAFNKDKTSGFFSSNRPGGTGSDDIYAFRNFKQLILSDLICGYVKDKNTLMPIDSATVFLLDASTNEVLIAKTNHLGYYESPVKKGNFYVVKAIKQNYFDDCQNFRTMANDTAYRINVPRDLLLDKYSLNRKFVLKNIYYDLGKWFIREDAKAPLDSLVLILKKYPIHIELGSHTDSRGSVKSNEILSQKRAEEAVNYLVSKGIKPERMTAKGYGESMLLNGCSDGVPCSEEAHQANRRTEFKITAIDSTVYTKSEFNPNVLKAGDKIPIQLLDPDFFKGCLENKGSNQLNMPAIMTETESQQPSKKTTISK